MTRAIVIVIALLAFAACTSPPAPSPVNISLAGDTDPNDPTDVLEGAQIWAAAGIGTNVDVTAPVCVPEWWTPDAHCTIPITVQFLPQAALQPDAPNGGTVWGAAGGSDGRTIYLDAALDPATMAVVAAHEIGHVIFDTTDHLPVGELGIMDAVQDGSWQATDADLAYAAAHTDDWTR